MGIGDDDVAIVADKKSGTFAVLFKIFAPGLYPDCLGSKLFQSFLRCVFAANDFAIDLGFTDSKGFYNGFIVNCFDNRAIIRVIHLRKIPVGKNWWDLLSWGEKHIIDKMEIYSHWGIYVVTEMPLQINEL